MEAARTAVTPRSVQHLVLPAFALVAVLVLVTRPLVAYVSALRTDLTKGERGFIGWMAPRGIVAAATASTFAPALVSAGVGGAQKILPATFVVIVMTVSLYGLTAAPVARRLGVMRPERTRALLIGGEPWVIDLGRALRSAGSEILMWAGPASQREDIKRAGLELASGRLIADATGRGAEIEGVTALLLLTAEDDFNALASMMLAGSIDGPVYCVGPPPDSHGVFGPNTGADVLFGAELSRPELARRFEMAPRSWSEPGMARSRPAMTCSSASARAACWSRLPRGARQRRRTGTGWCSSVRRPITPSESASLIDLAVSGSLAPRVPPSVRGGGRQHATRWPSP